MAAYENTDHEGRLVLIPQVIDAFADLCFGDTPEGSIPVTIFGVDRQINGFQVNEAIGDTADRAIFNMPFLFHRNGEPWKEANSFLLSLVKNKHVSSRPADEARRKASRLLDYLIFTENNNIHWMDFSGRRIVHRPTYKYHLYLFQLLERGPAVANQYTSVVYQFYKFVSMHWHPIDIARVDSVREIKVAIENKHGFTRQITVEKRSQTQKTNKGKVVPIGLVDDEGECLRPLTNPELSDLLSLFDSGGWDAQERLIILLPLLTGSRKQTVLTLRVKHVEALMQGLRTPKGTYLLKAGPRTGIDTKGNKPQTLHVPEQLAEDLLTYVRSAYAKNRRKRFQLNYATDYPHLKSIPDEDMYVFLSEQANCYYMASNDPRFPFIKTRPLGAVADTLKKKIKRSVSSSFPRGFTYHWLRATFAYQLYQHLIPLLKGGHLLSGEDISIIQSRMHHERRETTENYLKLFKMTPDKIRAQEDYEGVLFKMSSYSDLILVDDNA
ncbi:site-specific integrase [Pseudomonas cannabina]|uniref:site-specific integrase n=1 Tax=Pseudomonas syringae group TaxID=136849 RepID=UPI0001AF48FB|nr:MULTISPECIES: site-specific integrase [Pseudomonas syringae group]KPB73347.1 Site-specific recombinase [Pseudomonas syringae pv. maculicola]MCQ3017537.1 site-specific integrase [Pseudomonas tremae]QGL55458.1 tyrosine-type recombinase/integrase [Pseudomonas coronafaciens pv. oryzae str. 1_6]QQN22709.1 site-specific integrase [Pseudomonas cannabina pv. alisalensis]